MRRMSVAALAIAVSLAIVAEAAFALEPSFTGIGDLPGGKFTSYASGVSSDGSLVTGRSWSVAGGEAVRWTPSGGISALAGVSGDYRSTYARAVSADGGTVVGEAYRINSGYRLPYSWTAAGGMVLLDELPGGDLSSSASDVSADGQVVVGHSAGKPVVWTGGGSPVFVGSLYGLEGGYAQAVSNDGTVIVGASHAGDGHYEPFLWTAATGMVGLGFLPGHDDGRVGDLSGDGRAVVGQSANKAFLWTAGTGVVDISAGSGAISSDAYAVSGDGSVVVGRAYWESNNPRPFIWDEAGGLRDLQDVLVTDYGLDLSGWTLISADGISDDGLTIVGFGRNPAGTTEGFVAVVPEPASALLVVVGAVGLAARRRRAA